MAECTHERWYWSSGNCIDCHAPVPIATMTATHYEKKPGTKNAWAQVRQEEMPYTREQYDNCVGASPFFRRLGGSETVQRAYTSRGYVPIRIISTSPDRQVRTVREFAFREPSN